ncbi:MAG: hypothetical protein U0930_18935 [Pirellulales bacterium]
MLQLKSDTVITAAVLQSSISSFDSNDDGDVSVSELWMQASGRPWIDSNSRSRSLTQLNPVRFKVEGLEIDLVPQKKLTASSYNRLILIVVVVVVGILGLLVGPKLRSPIVSLLANQPWVFWGFVAVAFAFILPVYWPSWIVAFTAVWMALSQLMDYRRRTRHFGF